MKVILRQSGGYAAPASDSTCELNTSRMKFAEAELLRNLVQESRLLESRDSMSSSSSGADLATYVLRIEGARGTRQFIFDDLSIPGKAVPLLDYLAGHCRHEPTGRAASQGGLRK